MTCGLIVLLCYMCRWDRLAMVWSVGDRGLWLVTIVLLNLSLLAGALALYLLVRDGNSEILWTHFVLDYAHVQAICQVTPGQLGEALLPYMNRSTTAQPGTIVAGLVMQRIVAVLVVSLAAVVFCSSWMRPDALIAFTGGGVLFCVVVACLIGHTGIRAAANHFIGKRCGPVLNGFYSAWQKIVHENRTRRLLPHALLMILRYGATVTASYVVFRSFDISVPYFALTGVLAVATLATLIPISLSGLGVVEAVTVLSLRSYGVNSEEILAACLVGRGLTLIVLLNWSLVFWTVRWTSHRSTQRAA